MLADGAVDLLGCDSSQVLRVFIDILWVESALHEAEYLSSDPSCSGEPNQISTGECIDCFLYFGWIDALFIPFGKDRFGRG